MAIQRHVELKVMRAVGVDACTFGKARSWVYVKVSHKNSTYTTETVKDMGQNPNWDVADGAIWFPFTYENENEYITLELFNRNDICIGKSTLLVAELSRTLPEHSPEEKILPVMVPGITRCYHKQFGKIVILTQIKQHQAVGELGVLEMVLHKGYIKGITNWRFKVSEINAKVIYKHKTCTSGTLPKEGDKFLWLDGSGNTFSFLIDSLVPNDKVKIEVYNFQVMVGECEILMEILMNGAEIQVPLLVRKKTVGTIELATKYVPKSQSSVPPIRLDPSLSDPHQATAPMYRGSDGGHYAQSRQTPLGGPPGRLPVGDKMIQEFMTTFQ